MLLVGIKRVSTTAVATLQQYQVALLALKLYYINATSSRMFDGDRECRQFIQCNCFWDQPAQVIKDMLVLSHVAYVIVVVVAVMYFHRSSNSLA